MDGAKAYYLYLTKQNAVRIFVCVGGHEIHCEDIGMWMQLEWILVQILAVVATIQVRTLKTEVEKGSVWTVLGHGLVAPKTLGNSLQKSHSFQRMASACWKGKRLIFLYRIVAMRRLAGAQLATKMNFDSMLANILERVFFSF